MRANSKGSIAAWTLLFLGLVFATFAFSFAPEWLDSKRAKRITLPMGWKRSLLGGHVKLPLKDSQGFTLPQGHSLLVVTVSCSSCTSSAFLETLERSRIKPAIIVSLDGLAAIPKTILKRPKSYLILGDKNKYSLPSDMIRFAPQVATIDKHGKIIEIPGETTTFEEYIS